MNGIILSDIAHKMWTVPQLWGFGFFLSLPFVVVAFRIRGKAGGLVAICLAGGFSAFLGYRKVNEAFDDGSFGKLIMQKAGPDWVAHSIASSFVPLVLTVLVVVLRRPWVRPGPR